MKDPMFFNVRYSEVMQHADASFWAQAVEDRKVFDIPCLEIDGAVSARGGVDAAFYIDADGGFFYLPIVWGCTHIPKHVRS